MRIDTSRLPVKSALSAYYTCASSFSFNSTSVNGLPPIHPGEYIREALDELGITQATLAKAIGISPMRVSHLVREERPVTADIALRLGQAFGQNPQYWLNLQDSYDLKLAQARMGKHLESIPRLAA